MDLDCPHLSLGSRSVDGGDDRRVVVVHALDALRLTRFGGFDLADVTLALWDFERARREMSWEIRRFAAQASLASPYSTRFSDEDLALLIERAIRRGGLVAVAQSRVAGTDQEDASQAARRLVSEIERETRGRLSEGSRQYKLVAGPDLAGVADRDSYEVVRRDEALRVLGVLAGQAGGGLAALLGRARDQLAPDWRPPLAPKGLVLLRRMAAPRAVASAPPAAMTPSQLRAAMETDKPLQFFARFVDERGEPVTGFAGDFEHGGDPKVDMAFSGADFARKGECKGDRKAWLSFAEEAIGDVVEDLKRRWQKIRGDADDSWKEKEQSLVEVLFKEGKLPALVLEAEKKHTFMLRPPVAQARLHGMYFDTNKCFLLPSAAASLRRLVEIYGHHPDSEVLIVGHADTAGSEDLNLELSADRADAMKAFLRDEVDAWLGWYDESVRESKRWGEHEDLLMIDALVPDAEFGAGSHVAAYQKWHNGATADACQEERERTRPEAWEELKVDGVLGPKTRRQLVADYMNLDGTTLAEDVRVVTYGCGEYFPLASEGGESAEGEEGAEERPFDRRVEVLFFAKPFGILPAVPGLADGESSKRASQAAKGDEVYLEWRRRVARDYEIDMGGEGFRVRLCDFDLVPYAKRPFAFCLEGHPEIRGTTDDQGFVVVDSPPAGARGYVEVWPSDDYPEDRERWRIDIGTVISAATPRGAAMRLSNLDYLAGEPTDEMTEELREALRYLQSDVEGLEVTGEIGGDTRGRLGELHECEPAAPSEGEKEEAGEAGSPPDPEEPAG
ncbi:MAG: OmpA family protein [Deltaproteobacteria bacterium]|nr:OmpA family protein [Deltaproteobacteria bacterium]